MRRLASLTFVFLISATFGCQSKVTGTLEVDGEPFVPRVCRSGQAFGFRGVELTDEANRRLRLFINPDGTTAAALFKGDSPTGDRLGQCGALRMEAQSSKINNITNVRGTAQLSCKTDNHHVSGNLEFENCH
jgi:hypothetical protein